MLQNTRAIVIHTFPYSDSSLILKAYTEKFGYASFLLKGFKKNRKQKVILHPMALVEISALVNSNSSLKVARSIDLQNPYSQILMDPVKSGMAMFLAEWLGYSIHEEGDGDHDFFDWLTNAVDSLDHSNSIANFHIWFLIKLSGFLGFAPQGRRSADYPYFNIKEGQFASAGSFHGNLNTNESLLLNEVLNKNLQEISLVKLSKNERAQLLQLIKHYYQIHLEKEFNLKSLDVLTQLYD